MQSDRELLELAAKAVGIAIQFPYTHGVKGLDIPPRRTDTWENWNPLNDDGDALRLAVKLKIDILHSVISVRAIRGFEHSGAGVRCDRGYDRHTATRRAIVRAAAAIAEAMP